MTVVAVVVYLPSLSRSTAGEAPGSRSRLSGLFSTGTRSALWKLRFSGSWQFRSELAFYFTNDLGIWDSLSRFVLRHNLRLFIDGRREFLLGHLFGGSSLHNRLAEGLIDFGNGADIGGFFELFRFISN